MVVEGKCKKESKKHIVELETNAKLNFSKYQTRKKRPDSVATWAERHGGLRNEAEV